jgi:CRP-like cAMP-binding protein
MSSSIATSLPLATKLASFLLFRGLPDDVPEAMANIGFCFDYPEDTQVVVSNDNGKTFFLMLEGNAIVRLYNRRAEPTIVTVLKAGDFFGEMAILEDQFPRTADVVSVTPIRVLTLQGHQFLSFVQRYPAFALNITRYIARRLRVTNERLVALSLTHETRVARTLIHASHQELHKASVQHIEPIVLPPMTLSDWALMCQLTQRELLSVLERLHTEGIITYGTQCPIAILSMSRLKEKAMKDSEE